MQIDEEYLVSLRGKAEAQRQRLLSELHQATGALGIIDALLERLKQKESPDGL